MSKLSRFLSLAVVIFSIVLLASCDGRKSSHQALKESIETFKKEASIEINEYFPNDIFESEVDTILDSGYRVRLKTTVDSQNHVIITRIKDTINYQRHYKNFIVDLELFKENELMVSEVFTKERMNTIVLNSEIRTLDFENQVLNSFNIDFEKSNSSFIIFELIYKIPESEEMTILELVVKPNGDFKVINKK